MGLNSPIAFVADLEPQEQTQWLTILAEHNPAERILPLAEFAASGLDPAAVELAIVANPDPALLQQLPNLKWVQSLWAGVERLLPVPALAQVPIVRMIDPHMTQTMAEAVLAWCLYLHRDMPQYAAQQRSRQWLPQPVLRMGQRSVGVLGLGALGSAAALLLARAGFRTLGWSRSEKTLPGVQTASGDGGLPEILAESDIVVCLLPLTSHTHHLLDAAALRQCRPGTALVNFARGPLVDSAALLQLLDAAHLSHAVLDVFDVEPLPEDSPMWRHPRVTVLPHVTAPTDPHSAGGIVAANIRQWRENGRLPAAVSRALGY